MHILTYNILSHSYNGYPHMSSPRMLPTSMPRFLLPGDSSLGQVGN